MDAEKLFDAILNTYYSTAPGHDRGKAVALLTRAIEEETQARENNQFHISQAQAAEWHTALVKEEQENSTLRAQMAELREAAINAEMDLHGTPDGEALASALARMETTEPSADEQAKESSDV